MDALSLLVFSILFFSIGSVCWFVTLGLTTSIVQYVEGGK